MKKKYSDARKTLLKAFEDYIQHNQWQLDRLKPQSPYDWPPAEYFFDEVLGRYKALGFHDWICCHYYCLLKYILKSFAAGDPHHYFSYRFNYPFEEIKWWQGQGISDYEIEPDHAAPETVLHNLNALFNVLNFHMERILPLTQKKVECNYQENDLIAIKNEPLSTQIYKTLENLKLRSQFAASIMEKNIYTSHLSSLCRTLEKARPAFEGYIKSVAVQELKATLKNTDLKDKEAIKRIEDQLNHGITLELLRKNRQSKLEKDLKLLSLISIFIGIGIFTTLGLVCKRLYDSNGTSINFFKPLSTNLHETIDSVISDLEDLPASTNTVRS
jgi:hypothetical protein